jgi:hypothetical protein
MTFTLYEVPEADVAAVAEEQWIVNCSVDDLLELN